MANKHSEEQCAGKGGHTSLEVCPPFPGFLQLIAADYCISVWMEMELFEYRSLR